MRLFTCIFVLIFALSKCEDYSYITLSSALKLKNTRSGVFLYTGQLSYQTGSFQQAVTGVLDMSDVNSYWQILGKHGGSTERGIPVACGSVIRLKSIKTKKYLHSHQVKSPLTDNQEVSAYGKKEVGDGGDNWYLRCPKSEKYWSRNTTVQFEHVDTGVFLAVSGSKYRGAKGQYEVVGVNSVQSPSANWIADAGVYFPVESDVHTEL